MAAKKKKCSKFEFMLFFNDIFICPTHFVLLVVIVRFQRASSAVVGLYSLKEEKLDVSCVIKIYSSHFCQFVTVTSGV